MRKKKDIPTIPSVELVSVPVVAHPRKLEAKWTVDVTPDVKAYFDTGLITKEFKEAIERELDPLYDLKQLVKKAKRKYKNEPL